MKEMKNKGNALGRAMIQLAVVETAAQMWRSLAAKAAKK